MWESPIYKMNQLIREEAGSKLYREVVINVTRSAPSFDSPGKTLARTLRLVLKEINLGKQGLILDFGAGKLRNALHLLETGYRVCAVEYKDLFHESDQASTAHARARRYSTRFSQLVYPHQFFRSRLRVDLVLLINVLNIMPIPAERLLVLQECHRQLRSGGHLLWYTQRGDADYATRLLPQYRVGDGYFVGRRSKYKTFYREFTVAEIDEMLLSAGFELLSAVPATPRNQARLYRKTASTPLATVLSADAISAANVIDESIPAPLAVKPRTVRATRTRRSGDPDPEPLKLPNLYLAKLQRIPVGRNRARDYQVHVRDLFRLIFKAELRDLTLERGVFGKLSRLDILASNKSREGFFHSLKADHGMICPTIVIECKNYRYDVGNPEFDQLGGRLGRKLGRVGILAFRSATDWQKVLAHCRNYFDNDDKLIIPLSDADFGELLSFLAEGKIGKIESYLDRRVVDVKAG